MDGTARPCRHCHSKTVPYFSEIAALQGKAGFLARSAIPDLEPLSSLTPRLWQCDINAPRAARITILALAWPGITRYEHKRCDVIQQAIGDWIYLNMNYHCALLYQQQQQQAIKEH